MTLSYFEPLLLNISKKYYVYVHRVTFELLQKAERTIRNHVGYTTQSYQIS